MTKEEYIDFANALKNNYTIDFDKLPEFCDMAISALSENKDGWIPFSKELPPKGTKVHVSTFGIVTIGERTSEANEKLRLSILEPMNNRYTNVDPYDYQITRWQPLPEAYKGESEE